MDQEQFPSPRRPAGAWGLPCLEDGNDMAAKAPLPVCPHCHTPLQAFTLPDNTGWQESVQWACFNDDCPYYRDGWEWMWSHYRVRSSYRYRLVNQEKNSAQPLPVWSATALRDRIVDTAGGPDHDSSHT